MSTMQAFGYEVIVDQSPDSATVKWGKFRASLATLSDCGILLSPAGRAHKVPAWIINKLSELIHSAHEPEMT